MRTKNQDSIAAIEEFVSRYIDENGASPTIREIAMATGMGKSNVAKYVAYMREQGTLDASNKHRSIVTKEAAMTRTQMVRVPILGAVSCGLPKLAEENIEEYVRLPVSLFGKGDFFLLRANGDSMIDVGIDHGDLVLIRQQSTAEPGQIVVALIGDEEATLKRFYPDYENGIFRLHPENPTMEDIIVDNCIIQGVAVKVIKDLM